MSSRKRRHNTPPELPPRRSTRGTTASIAEPVYRVVIGLDAGTVNGTAAFWRTLIDAPHKPVGIRDIEYVEKYHDKKTFSNFHNGSRTIPMQILYGETPKHEKRIGWGIFLEQSRQSTWINQNLDRLLSGFKILLDESDALKVPRDELRRKVALLKEQDFINEEEDIFENFFKIWLKYIRMKGPRHVSHAQSLSSVRQPVGVRKANKNGTVLLTGPLNQSGKLSMINTNPSYTRVLNLLQPVRTP